MLGVRTSSDRDDGAGDDGKDTSRVCSSRTRPIDGTSSVDACMDGPMALRAGVV